MRMTLTAEDLQELVFSRELPPQFHQGPDALDAVFDINIEYGRAVAREIILEGIHIIYSDVSIYQDLRLLGTVDEACVEMQFHLKGTTRGNLSALNKAYVFTEHDSYLAFFPAADGSMEFDAQSVHKNFQVHMTPDFFLQIAQNNCHLLDLYCRAIERGEIFTGIDPCPKMTPPMFGVIQQILNCQFEGGMKKLYLQSKVMELFALHVQHCQELLDCHHRSNVSHQDQLRLEEARRHLLDHMSAPPTLSELSRLVGLNEFKLKKGFRELFGNSVYGYLLDHKLQHAHQLLTDTRKSINEISHEVGYKNQAHFTTAFKKKFGYTPGYLK
ncbi:MAG: AraC family transcriptional regulator [Bacteroidota bacterium]